MHGPPPLYTRIEALYTPCGDDSVDIATSLALFWYLFLHIMVNVFSDDKSKIRFHRLWMSNTEV